MLKKTSYQIFLLYPRVTDIVIKGRGDGFLCRLPKK
jgi:hypothetical protein